MGRNKKRIPRALACALLLLTVAGCANQTDALMARFGIDWRDYAVVSEMDTHGGFHGDGLYILELDCSGNREKALDVAKEWHALPLSENLSLLLYGGERDGVTYEYVLDEGFQMPSVQNGWYRFIDRHSERTDPADDGVLLDRASMNFSLAVYDSEADRLYVVEYDT